MDVMKKASLDALVASLFVNGGGQIAERLVLTDATGRDLGGWCRGAIRDRIEAFAARVDRDAREECAKVCDADRIECLAIAKDEGEKSDRDYWRNCAARSSMLASAIRSTIDAKDGETKR